uniref:VPS37 C-terminal domain-containing protein n=1 Tax=Strongyloides papillosus TaxID=174720 RepID=A0A0N5CHY8_STREA
MSGGYRDLRQVCLSSLIENIKEMKYSDLQDLLSNDEYQKTLVETLPEIKSIPSEKEALLLKMRSQALKNLALEPEINMARDKLLKTHQKANEILKILKEKKAKLDELGEERSLQSINNTLISAQHEAEDIAEAIAKQFVHGDIELNEFKKLFIAEKSKALSRKLKKEKLEEIIREQEHVASMNAFSRDAMFNQPGSTPYPSSNDAPYPMSSVFPQPIQTRQPGQGPITPYPAGLYGTGAGYPQVNRHSFW